MKYEEILQMLEFSQKWIDLGIINPEILEDLRRIHEQELEENRGVTGEYNWESAEIDSDHFRWRAFSRFIEENRSLPTEILVALYKLGEKDSDLGVGGAMMARVIGYDNCPIELVGAASKSDYKYLARLANGVLERRSENNQ
jgi:hypothetical protein